jgi:hypothetical protein
MSDDAMRLGETALADWYYERRNREGEWGEPEPLERPARLR